MQCLCSLNHLRARQCLCMFSLINYSTFKMDLSLHGIFTNILWFVVAQHLHLKVQIRFCRVSIYKPGEFDVNRMSGPRRSDTDYLYLGEKPSHTFYLHYKTFED